MGILVLMAALVPTQAVAQNVRYILRSPSASQAQAACQRYGWQMVRNLDKPDIFLIVGSDAVPFETLKQWVKDDPDVKNLEKNGKGKVSEDVLVNVSYLPTSAVSSGLNDRRLTNLYGTNVWVNYVQQPALALVKPAEVANILGAGVVIAIVDTGVDPRHPVLAGVLVPGYDFTRNVEGSASELADLDQSTAAILEQSTTAILEQSTTAILEGARVVQLNQSTAAILEQSTAAILEGTPLPAYFGHGTMVAGLVHLVAPGAKIMPLKAFRADGTASTANIVRAIYYAADHGAKVINMSFSIPEFSDEVMRAINYASRKNVICIASVGNEASRDLRYPAALGNVIGVGSTTMSDQPSVFTNLGADMVSLAAPGEALVTAYPGGHYAAVWGTSFSAALVSGGAAVLVDGVKKEEMSISIEQADARRAFGRSVPLNTLDLGEGRLDLNKAVHYIREIKLPPVK
ncbi:MAG: S8 family serine peptidase [Acidobacteria bacterium]|nr:S8 family serine peptidase [Acidobacteriota bacterium]